MLKAGDIRRNDTGWIGQFIHFAVAEVAEKRAGSESILTKLSELMFIDVVRRYIETLPPHDSGWLAGLRDPAVGNALALIHARPSFNWTIEGLARQCGTSRSVMAERFVRLVGMPPMHYLAKWRMQVASEMLNRRHLQHGDNRRRDRLRIRGRLQPRVQEDDGRDAVGLAAGRAISLLLGIGGRCSGLKIEIGRQHDHVANCHAAWPRQHEHDHVRHFAGLQQTSRLPGFL